MMSLEKHTPRASGSQRLFIADAARPLALLAPCPAHAPTPLVSEAALAQELGVARLSLKLETQRMGLGSFKATGGAYAVAQMLRDHVELVLGTWIPADATCSDAVRELAADMTFITASAGNHGLSVAAGARVFGAKAAIVLGAAVPESFADRIRELNAEVIRVDVDYEASVLHAAKLAEENGWQHLADGSWEGYIDAPALVMEGYTVIAEECRLHFEHSGDWPTHIMLQAGVGGLAASFAAHVRDHWSVQPELVVVEPEAATCVQASLAAGVLTTVPGPESNMGRLDCKTASLIAFDSMQRDVNWAASVSDDEASTAADVLTKAGFATTPSGAAGFAGAVRHGDALFEPANHVLCIVSEKA